jgi:hypothetical protein
MCSTVHDEPVAIAIAIAACRRGVLRRYAIAVRISINNGSAADAWGR